MSVGAAERGEGLRARKKQATRIALHDAAIRLMTQAPPHSVTVEAICAEAGVSRRTFFNYFDSKEEALFLWDEEYAGHVTDAIRDDLPDASPMAAAGRAVRELFRHTVMAQSRAPLQELLVAHPELVAAGLRVGRALEDAVAEGVAARTGRDADDLYVQTVSAAVSAGVRVISRNWAKATEAGVDQLFADVFGILETGGA
ncbi:TetR/AcrR family transcriptional regulator [Amycolatopsis sp.]|uniref:TetR/AcrR family transcriptional regulator n=1 Tax=Amycolatopsis sp. TaxID=37632 RepID=UPI002D808EC0|nr:TetR family transcriptional regulator [Amycolatopsis sp.]